MFDKHSTHSAISPGVHSILSAQIHPTGITSILAKMRKVPDNLTGERLLNKALAYTGGLAPPPPPKMWLAAQPSATLSCMTGGVVGRDLLAPTSVDLDRHIWWAPSIPCGTQPEVDLRG